MHLLASLVPPAPAGAAAGAFPVPRSWTFLGDCMQLPMEEDPHQTHLLPPPPCRCFFSGLQEETQLVSRHEGDRRS